MTFINRLRDHVIDSDIAAAVDAVSSAGPVNSLGYDPWGFRPETAKLYFSLAKRIFQYFRPNVIGVENLPDGPMLVAGNHSGQFPFDGLVVALACLLKAQPPRLLRTMAERWFPTLPFINIAFSRSGVVLGDPINCRNLLQAGQSILVFPEGAAGCGKTWWNRYQLLKFGRGFMRLALQTKAPIVPFGVVGAEESIVSVANAKPLADLFKTPYMPVPALLPLLGPAAFVPLPTRFHVLFGQPLRFDGPFDDEDDVIDQKVAVVESAVGDLLAQGLAQRRGWFD